MGKYPVKILHVVFSLDPGGMENGLINLSRNFDPKEFEVHVCCLERAGGFASRFPYPDQIYVMNKAEGFSPRSVLGIVNLIRKIRPHVIHSHNLGTLIYSSLATLKGRWRPILHGEHGQLTGEHCEERRLAQRRKYFEHCQRLHTVSHSLRQHFVDFGFKGPDFDVIVNGVDPERFQPGSKTEARRELGLPEDSLMIGMLGRFGPFKRHDLLLEGFELLAEKNARAHLLIVGGGGPEEEKIRALAAASKHAARIHFTGFQDDTRRYYHAMDLLVIPSVNEGLSNALLEAMASGVPALCNVSACGSEEVITHGKDGFTGHTDSAEDLAKHLQTAIANPAGLIDMGRAARESVVAQYSIENMVQEYKDIYRRLARQD